MFKDIESFVAQCSICKENKSPNFTTRPPMGARFSTDRPFQRLYVDLLGPYPRTKQGNSLILIVLDHFSKFVFLKPLRKANATNIIRFIEHDIFSIFGVCEFLHSDNGKQFVSKEFQKFLSTYGVNHIRTALYSPQANASERVNRSILEAVRTCVKDDQTDWDEAIHHIAGSLRSRHHSATEHTPYQVVFGFPMVRHGAAYRVLRELDCVEDGQVISLPEEARVQRIRNQVAENLKKAHDRAERTYNLRSKEVKFRPGQEVYRRNFTQSDFKKGYNAKLAKKFIKCRILKCVGNSLYELEDMQGKPIGIYHAKDLKQ